MHIVDSHCHLNFPELKDRLDDVMHRAADHDVHFCMTVNTNLSETDDLIRIAERYPSVVCTVGVHPNETVDHHAFIMDDGVIDRLVHYTHHPKVVGLGETGLDYYYEKSPKDLQKKCFAMHLCASQKLNLPVVIHTRDADQDTIDLVKAHPGATGVFHCFSGDLSLARQALDLGYYISFSGIITFKKAASLRNVVAFVPFDRLLVETDSPYLAPEPYRGKSNEPAYTHFVAQRVAEIKQTSLSEVARHTTANYFHLFSKAQSLRTF